MLWWKRTPLAAALVTSKSNHERCLETRGRLQDDRFASAGRSCPGVRGHRQKVMKAIEKLGYVPDRIAGSLSSRRTNFITAILPTLTNSNFADSAQGLANALRAADYQLLIGYTMYDLQEEERVIRTMMERRPDAIVVAGTVHTKMASEVLMRAGIPIVEIWDVPEHPIDHAVGFPITKWEEPPPSI